MKEYESFLPRYSNQVQRYIDDATLITHSRTDSDFENYVRCVISKQPVEGVGF